MQRGLMWMFDRKKPILGMCRCDHEVMVVVAAVAVLLNLRGY